MTQNKNNKLSIPKNKKLFKTILIIIGVIIVIAFVVVLILKYKNNENFKDTDKINKNSPDYYKFSGNGLRNLVDEKGNICNVILIIYPFTDEKKYQDYLEAKSRGAKFIGCSSYINFPCITQNKHDITSDKDHISWKYNYFDLCFGWFHPFKNPNTCIPKDFPKALISESDFVRYNNYKYNENAEKEYDFIYICLKDNDKCEDGWQSENRNWNLAKKCIDIMCSKYKMRGLLIGRINCELPPSCHKLMETTDFMNYNVFINQYQKCRFIFVPNLLDASPRVLAEALCFNLPCLVNNNILGGWKYVNDKTGMLFNDEHDFENVLQKFLNKFDKYTPRKYFINNHGANYEGKEIIAFIKKHLPNYKKEVNLNLDEIEYLIPTV